MKIGESYENASCKEAQLWYSGGSAVTVSSTPLSDDLTFVALVVSFDGLRLSPRIFRCGTLYRLACSVFTGNVPIQLLFIEDNYERSAITVFSAEH